MKKLINISIILLSILTSTSYGYCVYNSTVGMDTYSRYDGDYPTVIKVIDDGNDNHFFINQNDFRCKLTDHRGQNDQSNLVIWRWVGGNDYHAICSINVFNKGGYTVITGNKTDGFKCIAYRDPQ